jgi:hypothetical protein
MYIVTAFSLSTIRPVVIPCPSAQLISTAITAAVECGAKALLIIGPDGEYRSVLAPAMHERLVEVIPVIAPTVNPE